MDRTPNMRSRSEEEEVVVCGTAKLNDSLFNGVRERQPLKSDAAISKPASANQFEQGRRLIRVNSRANLISFLLFARALHTFGRRRRSAKNKSRGILFEFP